jgi:NADH:ubiquinone oxidoreductase subunit K
MIELLIIAVSLAFFAAGVTVLLLRRELLAASAGVPLMAAGAIVLTIAGSGNRGESAALVIAALAICWTLAALSAISAHYRQRPSAELRGEEGEGR